MGKSCVYGIHNRRLFIADHIGIVTHPIRNLILSLKQIDAVVIHACIDNVSGNFHCYTRSFLHYMFILPRVL